MITVTVQIGNSDDTLPQKDWAHYISAVRGAITTRAFQVHFSGMSAGDATWQNAAFVFEIERAPANQLAIDLQTIRAGHMQESLAWTEGKTEFI